MKRIYLEITNACNLNCPFCTYEKGNNYLDINTINNYLDQIKEYCNYIYLHILGEPLLHPNFNEILDLLDSKQMHLQLVTNGILLYKYSNLLDHSCLRKLSISLHSINNIDIEDSYFDTIDNLIKDNNKTIELRFYDKDKLSLKLNQYLNKLNDEYNLKDTSKNNSYKLKDNLYVYFEDLFKWPDINDEVISFNGTCHGAIDMIGINTNADVCICCLDPKAYNKIGNLKENSLKEIIESEEYKKYIEGFKNNKIISELCSKCTYRLRFKS